jgi:hypothetical protein
MKKLLIMVVALLLNGCFSTVSKRSSEQQNSNAAGWATVGALLNGATQGILTSGNDAAKIGAGLMVGSSGLSSALADSSSDSYNTPTDNYSNNDSYNTLADNFPATSLSSTSACPKNFHHLSVNMPNFRDYELSSLRRSILDTSMSQIVSGSKKQGMSKSQTISMAIRQAEEFEKTAKQNAVAGAEMSTYVTAQAIVSGATSGKLPLSLKCSGALSMVESAQCAVIQQVWGAMANREIAKQIPVCW